jgi:hypothetical protein
MLAGINDEVKEIIMNQFIAGCLSLQLYLLRCYYIEYPDNNIKTPHHTICTKCVLSQQN